MNEDKLEIGKWEFEELARRKNAYGSLANIPFEKTHFKQVWCSNYKDQVKLGFYFELP